MARGWVLRASACTWECRASAGEQYTTTDEQLCTCHERKRATADEGGADEGDGAQAAKPRAKKAKLAEGEAEDAKNKPRYILFLGSSLRGSRTIPRE